MRNSLASINYIKSSREKLGKSVEYKRKDNLFYDYWDNYRENIRDEYLNNYFYFIKKWMNDFDVRKQISQEERKQIDVYKEIEDLSNKEGDKVDWQEKYLDKLDRSIDEIKRGFSDTENRISEMINKNIEYINHLDKERHDEIMQINNKIDSNYEELNKSIKDSNKWIAGLIITIILSIAALVITVILSLGKK